LTCLKGALSKCAHSNRAVKNDLLACLRVALKGPPFQQERREGFLGDSHWGWRRPKDAIADKILLRIIAVAPLVVEGALPECAHSHKSSVRYELF